MTRVLIFGPSTTYGVWDVEGGWAQRLRRYLDEKQLKDRGNLYFEVFNLGISGDTSQDILERLEFETKQRLKLLDQGEEVIIIISIGANDSLYNNTTKKYHIPIDQFKVNIENIIRAAKKYAGRVIFVGNKPIVQKRVDPVPWLPTHSYKEKFVEQYDQAVAAICKQKNLLFIDIYSPLMSKKNYESLLPDGVHPNSEGHKLIFEIVKNYLVKEKIIP